MLILMILIRMAFQGGSIGCGMQHCSKLSSGDLAGRRINRLSRNKSPLPSIMTLGLRRNVSRRPIAHPNKPLVCTLLTVVRQKSAMPCWKRWCITPACWLYPHDATWITLRCNKDNAYSNKWVVVRAICLSLKQRKSLDSPNYHSKPFSRLPIYYCMTWAKA